MDEEAMPDVARIDEFFAHLPVPLYRTDVAGRLLAANHALAQLLGFSSTQELLNAAPDVAGFYRDSGTREAWVTAIEDHGVVRELDFELLRRDGSTVWVRDTARVVRDGSGAVLYFEGALVDVSEKVKLQRSRDEFIATVSHELRNPISVVLGLSEEMKEDYDSFSEDERKRMIELIARESEEAAWLIEDLLVAYDDNRRDLSLDIQRFPILPEITRAAGISGDPIAVAGSDEAAVLADPGRTRQILRNLISNARRYGGPVIRVEVAATVDAVQIDVCDSGAPLDDAVIDLIFEPFAQEGRIAHSNSVGLGLSVSRKLARMMGGDVTYTYEAGWSCFRLVLPAG
jgi:two-component system, sensor histidine kinase LadS